MRRPISAASSEHPVQMQPHWTSRIGTADWQVTISYFAVVPIAEYVEPVVPCPHLTMDLEMSRPKNPFPADRLLREAWNEGYRAYADFQGRHYSALLDECPYSPCDEARKSAGWFVGVAAAHSKDEHAVTALA